MTDEWDGRERRDKHWHLDRKVPLALIILLLAQGATFIWSYATLTNRMDVVEQWIKDNRQITSRLERLEVQGEFIQGTLTRIENKLGNQ